MGLVLLHFLSRNLEQLIGLKEVEIGDDKIQGRLALHTVGLDFPGLQSMLCGASIDEEVLPKS